jgi:hypothetical protein
MPTGIISTRDHLMSIHNDHKRTHRNTAKTKAAAEREAVLAVARDLGREAFPHEPELALVTVSRAAAALFPDDKDCQIAYLQGYIEARTQHDAFKRGE